MIGERESDRKREGKVTKHLGMQKGIAWDAWSHDLLFQFSPLSWFRNIWVDNVGAIGFHFLSIFFCYFLATLFPKFTKCCHKCSWDQTCYVWSEVMFGNMLVYLLSVNWKCQQWFIVYRAKNSRCFSSRKEMFLLSEFPLGPLKSQNNYVDLCTEGKIQLMNCSKIYTTYPITHTTFNKHEHKTHSSYVLYLRIHRLMSSNNISDQT